MISKKRKGGKIEKKMRKYRGGEEKA